MDVATCNERIMGPGHVETIVDLAVRIALSYRTASHFTFPVDFQEMEVKKRQRSRGNMLITLPERKPKAPCWQIPCPTGPGAGVATTVR